MTELAKTEEGRSRLGIAAERLDKTVEHLGMQFREDLPQGEIDEQQVVVRNPHEQLPPQFIPVSESVEGSPPSTEDDRRVRPAEINDDMQGGLTESKLYSASGGDDGALAEPVMGMDLNIVDEPGTDLKELFSLFQ